MNSFDKAPLAKPGQANSQSDEGEPAPEALAEEINEALTEVASFIAAADPTSKKPAAITHEASEILPPSVEGKPGLESEAHQEQVKIDPQGKAASAANISVLADPAAVLAAAPSEAEDQQVDAAVIKDSLTTENAGAANDGDIELTAPRSAISAPLVGRPAPPQPAGVAADEEALNITSDDAEQELAAALRPTGKAEPSATMERQVAPSNAPSVQSAESPTAQAKPESFEQRMQMIEQARNPEQARPAQPFKSEFAANVAQQLQEAAMRSGEDGKLTLRLKPQGLGLIEMEIRSDAGALKEVVMRVQNPMVLEALRNDRGALGDLLRTDQERGAALDMGLMGEGNAKGEDEKKARAMTGAGDNQDEALEAAQQPSAGGIFI